MPHLASKKAISPKHTLRRVCFQVSFSLKCSPGKKRLLRGKKADHSSSSEHRRQQALGTATIFQLQRSCTVCDKHDTPFRPRGHSYKHQSTVPNPCPCSAITRASPTNRCCHLFLSHGGSTVRDTSHQQHSSGTIYSV